MEVKAKESVVTLDITITPEELEQLDEEFNRIYQTLGDKVEQFSKVWELKDKINLAVRE